MLVFVAQCFDLSLRRKFVRFPHDNLHVQLALADFICQTGLPGGMLSKPLNKFVDVQFDIADLDCKSNKLFMFGNAYRPFTYSVANMRSCCPFTSKRGGVMLLGAVLENVGLFLVLHTSIFIFILQAMSSMAKLQLLSTCLKTICRYKVLLFLNTWGDAVSFFSGSVGCADLCFRLSMAITSNLPNCFLNTAGQLDVSNYLLNVVHFSVMFWVSKIQRCELCNCANKLFNTILTPQVEIANIHV